MKKNREILSLFLFVIIISQIVNMSFLPDANATGTCVATGGTITHSGGRTIHTFTINGTYTVTSGTCSVQVLVVAGGGGGGRGGGGAGGILYDSNHTVTTQSYTVIVGAGGKTINSDTGLNGSSSIFDTLTANGGGAGGTGVGKNGGSGAGGGMGGSYAGGTSTQTSMGGGTGYGNSGGAGGSGNVGGGGGGANQIGGTGVGGNSGTAGNGGNGISNSITGTAVYYGGGGGGGAYITGGGTYGKGGLGGGGDGAHADGGSVAFNGTNGQGGGGGGALSLPYSSSASGGSGVVIISEVTPLPSPSTPTLTKVNTINSTAINATWTSSSGATWYQLNKTSPNGGTMSQYANTTNIFKLVTGLTPGTEYQFTVSAGNSSGVSAGSVKKFNYTTNIAPTTLSASLITYLSERTTWSNPTGNSSSFKIEDSTGTCSSYSTVTSDTGNTTNKYDLTSLTGNTKVCVRVSTNYAKGTNSSGTSSPSSVLSFYTLPAPPTGLTVTQTVSKQAHLSWTAPSDNGTVLGYFIEYSTNGGSTWNTAIANTGNSTTHFDHSGLTVGLTYTYRVSTIQYSGTSIPSATASKLIFQGIIINAFESDGTTTFAGNIIQSNSTSKNNVFPLVQGTIGLNGLIGNQNFTVKDSNNFVVFKDYNFNATSTGSASYSTHIYRVDCPSTLAGNDIKLEVNDTDGHRISSFNTPTCDSNNLVTFGNVFTGNGNSALSYSSQLLVAILNSTFNANPVSFSMNSVPIGTSYNSATEVATSPSFVIGSGLQTFSETFSLQLNKVITLSGVGSIGGGGSVGSQSLGSSPVSPNNTSQLNTINPPRMTAKFATNPMTGKFGQLLNGTMTLTWQNSKNLIVNSISVGDYVRWIFYPNQPFNLIGDTIYQNSATAYVADIPFNVQVPAMSCQLNMTASLGCAENNNQYDIPVKLNISVNGQQYVISSTLSVIVSNSPVNNPIVAYSVIGLISLIVLFALFRTQGGKPKRTSKYSKNENDLGKSKTAKELDKVLKKKK